MKIDIVYVGDELVVNLSGILKSKDLVEIERRVALILNDYEIVNIKFNILKGTKLDKAILNRIISKYNTKVKEA